MKGLKTPKKKIAGTLEMCIGNNLTPTEAAKELNLPMATVSEWLSKYWFYHKYDKSEILILQSNV